MSTGETCSIAASGICRRALVATLAIAIALCFLVTSAASAARLIYWSNRGSSTAQISSANLSGIGGGDLNTAGASTGGAFGTAISSASGRLFWGNFSGNKISFASLSGSGGGDLNIAGATVSEPFGVAIDPTSGRLYWANESSNKISFASLDGSGGGDLSTGAATVSGPAGVAVDPTAGRIYWANYGANKISFANLDGSGGGDLNTTGATVNEPVGVAVDPAAGRIYWADFSANKISYASLSGIGGGDLNTGGATLSAPEGVAVDPSSGRIYWADFSLGKISFANLDGSGGGDLYTAGATLSEPSLPALLSEPSGTGLPAISGDAGPGSTLSCSTGSWAPDVASEFFFQAPSGFSYQWSLNGGDIAGATQSTVTVTALGDYRCRVTAANQAGTASQTSAAHTIAAEPSNPAPGASAPDTKITQAKIKAKKRRATFKFTATGTATGFQCALTKKGGKEKFKSCASPKAYTGLTPGRYTFAVAATGPGGVDASPATKQFRISARPAHRPR